MAERIDAYGDVVAARPSAIGRGRPDRRRSSAASAPRSGRRGRDRRATAPAGRGQRGRPGRPRHRPAGAPARRAVPGRRARPGRRCWPPLVDGPVLVDNDVNWAARAERAAGADAAGRLRLPLPRRGPGLRGRQRRRGPPRARRAGRRDRPPADRRAGRPGHPVHRGLRRARACAGPARPPSTSTPSAPRSAHRRAPPHCGRWLVPSAAYSPQRSPSPIPRSSSSAAPGVSTLHFSRHSSVSSDSTPAPFRSGRPASPTTRPSPARATRPCTNSGTPSSTPPERGRLNVEPEQAATH